MIFDIILTFLLVSVVFMSLLVHWFLAPKFKWEVNINVVLNFELLTATTSPMVSERVAQKMSDMQNIPKPLCIWERKKHNINMTTKLFESMPLKATKTVTYLWCDFLQSGSRCSQQQKLPGVWSTGWKADSSHLLLWFQPDPPALFSRQQPLLYTAWAGHEQNALWNSIISHNAIIRFSLLPSETRHWIAVFFCPNLICDCDCLLHELHVQAVNKKIYLPVFQDLLSFFFNFMKKFIFVALTAFRSDFMKHLILTNYILTEQ